MIKKRQAELAESKQQLKNERIYLEEKSAKTEEKITQSKVVDARDSVSGGQQETSSQSSEAKTKKFKFNIPIKVDTKKSKKTPLKFQIVDSLSTVNKGVINFGHGSHQLSAADRRFLSKIASEVNTTIENIGARRLHTLSLIHI